MRRLMNGRGLGVIGMMLVLVVGAAMTYSTLARQAARVSSSHDTKVEVNFVTDVKDPRKLVGLVDNVFVGRVIAQKDTFVRDGNMPWTPFEVEVLHNIKGSLAGTVIVTQQGGFSRAVEELILVENDSLLSQGQTYLFATKVDAERSQHVLVPGYGDIPIKDARHRAELVGKFTQATREQIIFNPRRP
jgi:hypothetical protein